MKKIEKWAQEGGELLKAATKAKGADRKKAAKEAQQRFEKVKTEMKVM